MHFPPRRHVLMITLRFVFTRRLLSARVDRDSVGCRPRMAFGPGTEDSDWEDMMLCFLEAQKERAYQLAGSPLIGYEEKDGPP